MGLSVACVCYYFHDVTRFGRMGGESSKRLGGTYMITKVPDSVVDNVHLLLRLSYLIDDYGHTVLEDMFPDFVQSLFEDEIEHASRIVYDTVDDFMGYGLSMQGDTTAVEKLIAEWVFVDSGEVDDFRRILEDTESLMALREQLEGKKNRVQALRAAGNLLSRISVLTLGRGDLYAEYLASDRDRLEKLVRAERRGVIS